jgi:hypothetical protein
MWVHWIQKGIDPEVWGQLFSFGLKEVGEIGARAFATFTLAPSGGQNWRTNCMASSSLSGLFRLLCK